MLLTQKTQRTGFEHTVAVCADVARQGLRRLSKEPPAHPLFSIMVLNYNGASWLDRCLASLMMQTLAEEIEVIVADNASTDASDLLAADLMKEWPGWRVMYHANNLGVCGGYNEAARVARGRYLLFLNTDVWLEADCLERLLDEIRASGAVAATPLVMDYLNDDMQSAGEAGFDIFGLVSGPSQWAQRHEVLVANGPAILIERGVFESIGGFDQKFFMYAEEYDLCLRAWLAGNKVILAPSARVHHRGAVAANPVGGDRMIQNRTSDSKRFYANRNGLLVLMKNHQHFLLIMVPLQVALLALEAMVMGTALRRWSFIRRTFLDVIADCWRMRHHILAERRRIRDFRRRSDFWMLRFLRPRLNRWRELRRFQRFGFPTVDAK